MLLNIWISYSIGHPFDVVGVNAALVIALSSMIQAVVGGAFAAQAYRLPSVL